MRVVDDDDVYDDDDYMECLAFKHVDVVSS